ncbi:uncharacterized protein LOC127288466 isoform X2 [Leptopilina boulardi]|uniref:uncharacterized protein LOC127288466 isoform X2 n=1 Tax=Leptopilina boulardi TaxID=63433 RepID=UPI0021F56FD5|nr:uncharacterized protein LOC127288466 isoform X2 [Leptopilina boulardi]
MMIKKFIMFKKINNYKNLLLMLFLFIMYFFISIRFNYTIYDKSDKYVIPDGYLIWNSKCHMQSKTPYDNSILKFIKKEVYENCSNLPLLTSIIQDENGRNILILKTNESEHFKNLNCCWSPIVRPIPKEPKSKGKFDSVITVENCIHFNNSVVVPNEVDILMVTCNEEKYNTKLKNQKRNNVTIYKNVHSIINVEKVLNRLNNSQNVNVSKGRKRLSVLLLGIDNVSRLNFNRNLPKTVDYLDEKGWLLMKGYNKMGENTFPNLMAILTGQGEEDACKKCNPTVPFGLDNCPMLWYNFKNAGYVTAYAEDEADWSTFNYLKVGFVNPPTDYYLRPYIVATEKLLKTRRRFINYYCTGPELAAERILNFAEDFAIRFKDHSYFGFFWTNSITHNSLTSLSILDSQIHSRLKHLEQKDVMNDTIIIFLSDHGLRFGEFRNTFMGWYEDRLPFFYIWLPQWFRDDNPEVYEALTINQNRLTSPFDLYETLRDIVIRGGGNAGPSTGCPKCQSLFKEVPMERGCEDAGISTHWCACSVFEKKSDNSNQISLQGAYKVIDYIENIVKNYKTITAERLCSKFKLKKILRFFEVPNKNTNSTSSRDYYYILQLSPGDVKFEVTVHYLGFNNYIINDKEISRIDSYKESAKCLNYGEKKFCHCIK